MTFEGHQQPGNTSDAAYASLLWCLKHGVSGPVARIRAVRPDLPDGHEDRVAVEGGIAAIESAIQRLSELGSGIGRNG